MTVLNLILLLVYCSFLAIQLSAAAAAEAGSSKVQAPSKAQLRARTSSPPSAKSASDHSAPAFVGKSASATLGAA